MKYFIMLIPTQKGKFLALRKIIIMVFLLGTFTLQIILKLKAFIKRSPPWTSPGLVHIEHTIIIANTRMATLFIPSIK